LPPELISGYAPPLERHAPGCGPRGDPAGFEEDDSTGKVTRVQEDRRHPRRFSRTRWGLEDDSRGIPKRRDDLRQDGVNREQRTGHADGWPEIRITGP
jgi:hypothetical protein